MQSGDPRMNALELAMLVDLVIAYCPWVEPSDTLLEVWGAQAALGRWTFPEASTAVHEWARNRKGREYLDPSVVANAVRAQREDALSRQAAPEPYTPMVSEEKARARVEMMAAAFQGTKLQAGSLDDVTTFDRRGRHVACEGNPSANSGDRGCGAAVGEVCKVRVSTRRNRPTSATFVHPTRLERELDFVNEKRRERGMPPVSQSAAKPKLPEYARTPRDRVHGRNDAPSGEARNPVE
jgi:hypothetical protein